jgi:hypothetical protein
MPLLPDSKVAKDRYGVCLKTLSRWDEKPELKFPAAKTINNRKYRSVEELDAWDATRAAGIPVKPAQRGSAVKSTENCEGHSAGNLGEGLKSSAPVGEAA